MNFPKITTRWMNDDDVTAVESIEKASNNYSWSFDTIKSVRNEDGVIPILAIHYTRIVGFLFMHLSNDVISVVNMATHPDYRRMGVASMLISKVKQKINSNRSLIVAETRETQTPAQLFFRKEGFYATEILRRHFQDELLDVECPPALICEDGYHFQYGNQSLVPQKLTLHCGT